MISETIYLILMFLNPFITPSFSSISCLCPIYNYLSFWEIERGKEMYIGWKDW
jgi:hypothetical protein